MTRGCSSVPGDELVQVQQQVAERRPGGALRLVDGLVHGCVGERDVDGIVEDAGGIVDPDVVCGSERAAFVAVSPKGVGNRTCSLNGSADELDVKAGREGGVTIEVDDRPGGGARFSIRLPLTEEQTDGQ